MSPGLFIVCDSVGKLNIFLFSISESGHYELLLSSYIIQGESIIKKQGQRIKIPYHIMVRMDSIYRLGPLSRGQELTVILTILTILQTGCRSSIIL